MYVGICYDFEKLDFSLVFSGYLKNLFDIYLSSGICKNIKGIRA